MISFEELQNTLLTQPLAAQTLTTPLWQFPEIIDSSMLATWRLCHEKARYSYNNLLAPPGHNPHLIGGGSIASGLHAARQHYKATNDQFASELLGYSQVLASYQGLSIPDHPHKNIRGVMDGYIAYLRKWPLSEDYLKIDYPEADFAIPTNIKHPITNKPILYAGRVDLLATHKETNTQWTVDEKTAGRLEEYLPFKFRFRPQFLGYNFALRKQYNRPVAGTIVRLIIINGSRLEPFEFTCIPTDEDLAIWWKQINMEIYQWKFEYTYGFATRNGDACTHWYRPCEFFDLCNSPKSNLTEGAKSFARNEWSPLHERNPHEIED